MKADIREFLTKLSEVEIIDSFNAIERHLLGEMQKSGSPGAHSDATCRKLKGDLRAVFSVLPKDMQQLLLMNPHKAALLQSPEWKKLPGHALAQVGIISSTSPR